MAAGFPNLESKDFMQLMREANDLCGHYDENGYLIVTLKMLTFKKKRYHNPHAYYTLDDLKRDTKTVSKQKVYKHFITPHHRRTVRK